MSIKLKSLLLPVLMVVLFSGCAQDTKNERYTAAVPPENLLSGKLSIAQCNDYLQLGDAVEKFTAHHPGVEIDLIKYENDAAQYLTQLSADLSAGTAPDLFERTWNIDDIKLADIGLIENMQPFIAADTDFNDQTYFMNVFEGMAYRGGLYSFPIVFQYEMVGVNENLPETVRETFRVLPTDANGGLMALFMDLENTSDFYIDSNFDAFVAVGNVITEYIDYENKTCAFNTPAFIQLLEDAKANTAPDKEFGITAAYSGAYPAEDTIESRKYAFKRINGDNYQYFMNYEEFSYTDFKPITVNGGYVNMLPQKEFLMNADAADKELAWAFLEFLTSEEANTDILVPGLPVKKDVYDVYMNDMLEATLTAMTDEVGISPAGGQNKAVADAKEVLNAYSTLPMLYQRTPYSELMFEDFELFNNGTISAEALAETLQYKISAALME